MTRIGYRGIIGKGLGYTSFYWTLVLFFSCAAVANAKKPLPPLPPPGAIEIEAPEPLEISGVAAVPGEYGGYAVVGDEEHETGRIWPGGAVWRAAVKGRGDPAEGLEAVDAERSPTGEELWLVLGEDNRTLSDLSGVNFKLPERYKEICGRGLEGLAIRWNKGKWQVAVLWEGGYFEGDCAEIPKPEFALPRVAVFEWIPGKGGDATAMMEFELNVPRPPGSIDQGFRATDLAWLDDDSDRLIVLLNSTGSGGYDPYNHTWLHLFDLTGEALQDPKPFKLEDEWGDYRDGKNWEALDHSLDRSRLVMGFDADSGRRTLVVFPSPFRK